MLKFAYLKNEKSFPSEIKSIFTVSQVLSFRYTKQTCKNVAHTNFKAVGYGWLTNMFFILDTPERPNTLY